MYNAEDMLVIIYKILFYIYACNKKGIDVLCLNYKKLGINEKYFNQIMKAINNSGYVCSLYHDDGFNDSTINKNATITAKGVMFLECDENMRKVGEVLKDRNELDWWV